MTVCYKAEWMIEYACTSGYVQLELVGSELFLSIAIVRARQAGANQVITFGVSRPSVVCFWEAIKSMSVMRRVA